MKVTIESIDQKLKLDGSSELVTYLALLLPNGESVSALVDSEVAQTVIKLAAQPDYVTEAEAETTHLYDDVREEFDGDVFGGDVDVEPQGTIDSVFSDDSLISWRELPDTSLPAHVKLELQKAGVPEQLKVEELVELTESITEKLMEKKKAQPKVQGVVQRVQSPPIKTVPKDEMGYPRVTNVERDPGEVAQMGTDEDGVPQL